MKIILYKIGFFLAIIGCTFSSLAQTSETPQFEVDVYTGGPNITAQLFKVVFKVSDVDARISSTPLIGMRVSKMWEDNVSLGLDVNYRTTSIEFSETFLDSINNYKIKNSQIRIALRAEYHLKNDIENLDIYFPALLGYKYARTSIDTNDPLYQLPAAYPNFSPFSVRLGVGLRYFIVENVGINTEIGVGGGAFLQAGLSLRF